MVSTGQSLEERADLSLKLSRRRRQRESAARRRQRLFAVAAVVGVGILAWQLTVPGLASWPLVTLGAALIVPYLSTWTETL
jgi:hypothetical protein